MIDIKEVECNFCERTGEMVRSVIAEEESTDESFGRATMLYQCEFCKMVSIKKE